MFLARRFYIALCVVVLVLASGYLWSPMFLVGRLLLLLFVVAVLTDAILLWVHIRSQKAGENQEPAASNQQPVAFRQLPDRFSRAVIRLPWASR